MLEAEPTDDAATIADRVARAARDQGLTVAVAESLTSGAIACRLGAWRCISLSVPLRCTSRLSAWQSYVARTRWVLVVAPVYGCREVGL